MSTLDVCELISNTYELVYSESEELGLVRVDRMEEYTALVKIISS